MAILTVGAVAIGAIKTAGEVAKSIKSITEIIPKAANELTEKFRWMTISIRNETQFELVHTSSFFETGRLWDAPPGVIKPFQEVVFSACSKDGSIGVGFEGGIRLKVELDINETLFVGVGFGHRAIGSRKASVIFHEKSGKVARDAHAAIDNNTMKKNSRILTGLDRNKKPIDFKLVGVSSPGQGTKVTITQKIL